MNYPYMYRLFIFIHPLTERNLIPLDSARYHFCFNEPFNSRRRGSISTIHWLLFLHPLSNYWIIFLILIIWSFSVVPKFNNYSYSSFLLFSTFLYIYVYMHVWEFIVVCVCVCEGLSVRDSYGVWVCKYICVNIFYIIKLYILIKLNSFILSFIH
jgi:hypothetical protein